MLIFSIMTKKAFEFSVGISEIIRLPLHKASPRLLVVLGTPLFHGATGICADEKSEATFLLEQPHSDLNLFSGLRSKCSAPARHVPFLITEVLDSFILSSLPANHPPTQHETELQETVMSVV